MLEHYFTRPETVDRIRRSWIAGPIEKYVTWLSERAYKPRCVFHRVPLLLRFGEFARRRGATDLAGIAGHLDAFVASRVRQRAKPCRTKTARRQYLYDLRAPVEHFLRVVCTGAMPGAGTLAAPFAAWAPAFFEHLRDVRGLSATTVMGYAVQLRRFETYVVSLHLRALNDLTPAILDGFLAERSLDVSARSLGVTCAALRVFLRYAFQKRIARKDLSGVVDGPRTYSLSTVPRSIRAEDVARVLAAIDRRSIVGRRDHAMVLLMAVYGLRAREVAALTLDCIDWRAGVLHVRGRKGGHSATYPLKPEVGEAVLDYLKRGRPETKDRRVFFRTVAPVSAITYALVSRRAAAHLGRAGVDVPRAGSHTLRHSCAQRLVDADFSLKMIGDFLGHAHPSSTRIYSKVALDALREVALGDGEVIL